LQDEEALPLSDSYNIKIVHGSFGHTSSWYQEGGDFFEAVKKSAQGLYGNSVKLSSFSWNSYFTHYHKMKGGEELCQLLLCEFEKEPLVKNILIGHSCGGSVIMIASEMLAIAMIQDNESTKKEKIKELSLAIAEEDESRCSCQYHNDDKVIRTESLSFIQAELADVIENITKKIQTNITKNLDGQICIESVFLLGTPLRSHIFSFNQERSHYVYNFFSQGDFIQGLFGFAYQSFPKETEKILNFKTIIERTKNSSLLAIEHPSHMDIHSPIIGQRILEIPKLCETMEKNDRPGIKERIVKFNDNQTCPSIFFSEIENQCPFAEILNL
jgi:hypothetical protein